jgi:hypothetical protein
MHATRTYTVTVEDTITYRRSIEITVEARDKSEACRIALDRVDTEMADCDNNASYEEQQIDNTPYEVVAVHS